MLHRRRVLFVATASLVLAASSSSATSAEVAKLKSLLGTWKVSAVQEASASSDRATFAQSSESSVLLTLDGEVAKVMGGPVELRNQGSTGITGTSRTGVEVTLTPDAANRWNLELRGNGLYFSLFLVK